MSLSNLDLFSLPAFHWYTIIIVLRPTLIENNQKMVSLK